MERVIFNDHGNTGRILFDGTSRVIDLEGARGIFVQLADHLDNCELEPTMVNICGEKVYMTYEQWKSLYIGVDRFMDKFFEAALEEFSVLH